MLLRGLVIVSTCVPVLCRSASLSDSVTTESSQTSKSLAAPSLGDSPKVQTAPPQTTIWQVANSRVFQPVVHRLTAHRELHKTLFPLNFGDWIGFGTPPSP